MAWGKASNCESSRRAAVAGLAFATGKLVAVVTGRPQFPRREGVDADGTERHRAQFFQLRAFLRGDPALAHALVELRIEFQRLDVAVLERLEELALHRLGVDHRGEVAGDATGRVVV